jgi:hypothetical protein
MPPHAPAREWIRPASGPLRMCSRACWCTNCPSAALPRQSSELNRAAEQIPQRNARTDADGVERTRGNSVWLIGSPCPADSLAGQCAVSGAPVRPPDRAIKPSTALTRHFNPRCDQQLPSDIKRARPMATSRAAHRIIWDTKVRSLIPPTCHADDQWTTNIGRDDCRAPASCACRNAGGAGRPSS